MSDIIETGKYVELTYKVIDKKSGETLVGVEFPIGYIHGANDILVPAVTDALNGRVAGEVIEVPIDCNQLYGPRDEGLVFTDVIENVPEAYREIGTTITMENEKGEPRNFIVTRMDDKSLTVDGNNPLSGRHVIFRLKVLGVRNATDEELEAGGAVGVIPNVDPGRMVPI